MKATKIQIALVLLAVLTAACGGSSGTSNVASPGASAPSPAPQASPLTGFEKDLKYIKDGQFTYVWVFSRKDGKPLDKDDSAFLRVNAPQVVDWVVTDGGKKVIAGTNFNLEEGNLDVLRKRFVAEDYTSK
ncbi:MAG TPA: hypothetical protein VFR78_02135 [Pyrinomonadaceae bacterium]|nr:hypothetical protein [Pyrinomonadaceae bacterium]